jgi:hypothetical protein
LSGSKFQDSRHPWVVSINLIGALLWEYKIQLEEIASSEGRSTAQICEAFLRAGTDTYKKKENKVIKDFLTTSEKERSG